MNSENYSVRWLTPGDTAQVADLEARVHTREHRAGSAIIADQLEDMEWDGRNLSLGLYYGEPGAAGSARRRRMVGFGLAFVMRDRAEMGEFFDAPVPPQLPADQPTLYIADWVVLPEHRRATLLMAEKFITTVRAREDLRNLPIDAFSTPEYTDKWSTHERFVTRAGWRLADRHPFRDAKLGRPMYWLRFTRVEQEDSALLARIAGRIELLRKGGADVYHSAEYLQTWYAHIGVMDEPSPALLARSVTPAALDTLVKAATRARENRQVALASRGPLHLQLASAAEPGLLDRYMELEQLAPDDEVNQGATSSGKHVGFYKALAARHADALGMQVGLLRAGEEMVAGLLGFLWRRCFYLVHVTRPETWASLRADELALAMLTERLAQERRCDFVDLSRLERLPLRNWGTHRGLTAWIGRMARRVNGTRP